MSILSQPHFHNEEAAYAFVAAILISNACGVNRAYPQPWAKYFCGGACKLFAMVLTFARLKHSIVQKGTTFAPPPAPRLFGMTCPS
jgi:hypothetical protein